MPTRSTVQVTVDYDAVDRLTRSSNVRSMLQDAIKPVVDDARGRAPKASGRGARSVHSELVLTSDEWEAIVSWDQFHYYMLFAERGDRYRPPHPFLVPALKDAAR